MHLTVTRLTDPTAIQEIAAEWEQLALGSSNAIFLSRLERALVEALSATGLGGR